MYNGGVKNDEVAALLGELVQLDARLVRYAAHKGGSGESSAVWRTIGVLRQYGSLRLGQLASLSRVTQPTMTKLVAGLVDREWIERITDPEDARAWLLKASPAGIAASDAWRKNLASTLLPHFTNLTSAEANALQTTVQLLRQRVIQMDSDLSEHISERLSEKTLEGLR